MAGLDKVKSYIVLHRAIIRELKMYSARLNAEMGSKFSPEVFSHPEQPAIYVGFVLPKYNILFKKKILILDGKLELSEDTVIIGEKYADSLREKFDFELFDRLLERLDFGYIEFMQGHVSRLNEMRKSQIVSRR